MSNDKNNIGEGGTSRVNASHPQKGFVPQEKASIGGAFNSGVTSDDEEQKEDIEKKASLKSDQPPADNETPLNSQQQTGKKRSSL